jgi:putative FmdB family regulatory protein
MPTYQYQCKFCGHELEELQSMTEPPLLLCPKCNTENLARVMGTGVGLIFKGSGFYLTDYKKSTGSVAKRDSGEKKESGQKREGSEKKEAADGKETADKKEAGEKKESGEKNASQERKESTDKKESKGPSEKQEGS